MALEVYKLKSLLGIEGEEKDSALEFILEDVENIVLDYCHIDEIPERLKNTCYRMAMELYRNEEIGQEATISGNMEVTSISEGDTSVSFGEVGTSDSETNYTNSLLKNYEAHLNRYRKLVWD